MEDKGRMELHSCFLHKRKIKRNKWSEGKDGH